jgi:hypothetical protein
MLLALPLVMVFPEIALWLPEQVTGKLTARTEMSRTPGFDQLQNQKE